MPPQPQTAGDVLSVPGGRDADKIVLPSLPPQSGYEVWRFQVGAAVLAASARPGLVAPWLADVDSVSIPFHALSASDPMFAALDCRLFTALLVSLSGRHAGSAEQELALRARTLCRLGCGRQLLRIVDIEFLRDHAGRRQRALRSAAVCRRMASAAV